ncbi:M15 family metallopeptidase [Dyadobacter pollutisoli]|uniref:D-alanyl-D-alanine dipeptidase n=1 Tax=Dyadobacter pollutisoli TaxID=2910158 RepID=A0A9E8SPR7_9BACT|nr:M15 family metallopeptidase [Dyadobacter pollutisoli]WAC12197.1 M15 family metallopeptidase [Dyadobacter pollutisoli]
MNIFAAHCKDIHFFMLKKVSFSGLLLLFCSIISFAQELKKERNKSTIPDIEQRIIDQGLTDVQKANSEILVELKYATTDNFMGKNVYGDLTRAYLQPEMAKRLSKAATFLKQYKPGYQLLVYDAARPNSVQYNLWNALDDLKIPARSKTQYVADPKIGSNHNFGCAVDLTIVDEKGKPLDMGTKFDFFGPLAYPRSEQEMLKKGKLSQKQVENRQILRKVMTQAGFKANTTEWWHFDGMSKSQARAKYGMIK